ncbi:MAG: M48 family metalloprotease [Hyphomicrobiaceae bacterium]
MLAIWLAPLVLPTNQAHAQSVPLIRDTEIERLLNDYARPIFESAGLGTGRVAIRIVRSRIFNAFVIDGRNIFIHTGALMQSETPNQIIGVIAHEAGHIVGGDLAALRSRIQRDQTKLLLLRILGIGAAIASKNASAVMAGDDLVMRSLLAERRAQEGAADQRAMVFLNRTKQSGRGMLETFERFQRQEYISDQQKDPFVRSHPVATDRLALLRDRVTQSPYFGNRDSARLQLRHDMMRAKLSGYLEAPGTVFNRYPRRDKSLPAKYARAIATFFRGGRNGLATALRRVDELIKVRPQYPYFYELKADFLHRSGRPAEAIRYLRRSLSLDPQSTLMQIRLGKALLASRGKAAAKEVIRIARRAIREDEKFGDQKPSAYRVLGQAYYRAGQLPKSYAATAEAYFISGNLKQARVFAKRAQPGLKRGSPAWRRMDEIVTYKSKT